MEVKPLRQCSRCGLKAYTEEDLELFASNKNGLYGKSSWCKKCKYEYYHNKRISDPCEKQIRRAQGRRHYQRHKEEISKVSSIYRKLNPHKAAARNKAKDFPLGDSCELCGSTTDLHRHHPDYAYPEIFVTVCCTCHHNIHNLNCKGSEIEV